MGAAPSLLLRVAISVSLVMAAGLTFPPREPFRWRTRDGAKQKITPVSPLGSPPGDPQAARGERVTCIHKTHTLGRQNREANAIAGLTAVWLRARGFAADSGARGGGWRMCISKRDCRNSASAAKALLLMPMVARLKGGRREIKRKFGEFARRDGVKEDAGVSDGTLLIIPLLTILILRQRAASRCASSSSSSSPSLIPSSECKSPLISHELIDPAHRQIKNKPVTIQSHMRTRLCHRVRLRPTRRTRQ